MPFARLGAHAIVQKQVEAKAKETNVTVEKAKEDLLREKQPMLHFTTPEQIGSLAAFLCGDGLPP